MKRPKNQRMSFCILLLGFSFSACNEPYPYSEAFTLCNYTVQSLPAPSSTPHTSLTAECKTALEKIIPYHHESFKDAPPGFKNQITEAFQALIGYKLAFPKKNEILGAMPKHSGAIPLAFWEILESEETPNKSLFAYVLNQVDEIRYEEGISNRTAGAKYSIHPSTRLRRVTFFKGFIGPESSQSTYYEAYARASTLVHEARHGDGMPHILCDGPINSLLNETDQKKCDSELTGSYGLQAIYFWMLIQHYQGNPENWTRYHLDSFLMKTGKRVCEIIKHRVLNIYPELDALLQGTDCAQDVDPDWVRSVL
jgi:hypothetical protein